LHYLISYECLEDKPSFGDEIQGHKVRYPNIDAKKGKK